MKLPKLNEKNCIYALYLGILFTLLAATLIMLWVSFGIINGTHDASKHDQVSTEDYELILICCILHTVAFLFRPIAECCLYRTKSGRKNKNVKLLGETLLFLIWIIGIALGYVGYGLVNYNCIQVHGGNRDDKTVSQQCYADTIGIIACSLSAIGVLMVIVAYCYVAYCIKKFEKELGRIVGTNVDQKNKKQPTRSKTTVKKPNQPKIIRVNPTRYPNSDSIEYQSRSTYNNNKAFEPERTELPDSVDKRPKRVIKVIRLNPKDASTSKKSTTPKNIDNIDDNILMDNYFDKLQNKYMTNSLKSSMSNSSRSHVPGKRRAPTVAQSVLGVED